MNGLPPDSEARAVEALITAALHVWDHEVTAEEVEAYMQKEHALSSDDAAALNALRNSLLHDIKPCPDAPKKPSDASLEEFLVLYRKKPKEGFCQETVEEVNRRREELTKRLRSKSQEP